MVFVVWKAPSPITARRILNGLVVRVWFAAEHVAKTEKFAGMRLRDCVAVRQILSTRTVMGQKLVVLPVRLISVLFTEKILSLIRVLAAASVD